jgi:hypothetical protein
MTMRSSWSEPFLWIHLAGLAALPIALELCLLGFAIGEPFLPIWLELLLVGAVGILPILWMQLVRPFYIFSILVLAIKPEQLTSDQRRILQLFKTPTHQGIAIGGTIFLAAILWQIYQLAPIATAIPFLPSVGRTLGLLWAGAAFLISNLFLQVPLSVIPVLLTSDQALAAIAPYPVEKLRQDFTIPGLQVNQILPTFLPDEPTVQGTYPQPDLVAVTAPPEAELFPSEPVALEDVIEESPQL